MRRIFDFVIAALLVTATAGTYAQEIETDVKWFGDTQGACCASVNQKIHSIGTTQLNLACRDKYGSHYHSQTSSISAGACAVTAQNKFGWKFDCAAHVTSRCTTEPQPTLAPKGLTLDTTARANSQVPAPEKDDSKHCVPGCKRWSAMTPLGLPNCELQIYCRAHDKRESFSSDESAPAVPAPH